MNITDRLAQRAQGRTSSPIRELQKYMQIDDMISLGGGYPNPATFAFESVRTAFRNGQSIAMSDNLLTTASQYGPSDAQPALKSTLLDWHQHKDGIELDPNGLVVLNGSQEGLFIMAYLFLNADDTVIVDEPTYPGAISAFRSFTHNFLSVPIDKHGTRIDILEKNLLEIEMSGQQMPKFIYCIPNGHNPGGIGMSVERRKDMILLANEYDLLILEDDPYQLIKLDDSELLPSLQSLDTDGRVIRLDSFSKIFAPGLRIGYASAAPEIIREFVLFKQSSNMHTSSFIQELLNQYLLTVGFDQFRENIQQNCQLYRKNRDTMVGAAQQILPKDVTFEVPGEGMFIWFQLPEVCNAKRMVDSYAEQLKVLLVPGDAFSMTGGCQNCMRASFSMVSTAHIQEGMQRFAKMINTQMGDR